MAEISRWSTTQAERETLCPRCKAPAGEPCRTPAGRKTYIIHTERSHMYRLSIGDKEFDRRHKMSGV